MRSAGREGDETRTWVAAARRGDAASFARLYERVAPAVYTWADLRIRSDQRAFVDPQDVVQEVWLRAWRGIAALDASTPFRPWIFAIAKNVLLEAFRSQARAEVRGGARGSSTRAFVLANVPDDATAISRRVARDENLATFAERVRALPDEDRKLVVLCGLEGLTHKEAGQRLELTAPAVAKRWQRLRARLLESGLPRMLLAD